jgi:arylsulfate sulfotransferase
MLRTFSWISLAVCAGVFTFGCGGGSMRQVTSITVSPQSAFVGASQVAPFTANVTGGSPGVIWSVNGTAGGNSTVGTIDSSGNYTAPAVTANSTATVTATSMSDSTKSASASVTIIAAGVVAATTNAQVATYAITPPSTANVSIQFGTDTTYGLTTWQQPTPAGGGPVSIFVAGMRINTPYHMRAVLKFADGTEFDDVDHTFTTGDIPVANLPSVSTVTTAGATPQPGVELLDLVGGVAQRGIAVSDLAGNIIWTYDTGLAQAFIGDPVKLLPNGHFLMNVGLGAPDGANSFLREVDLVGNTIWQMDFGQLNKALSLATCLGCNITIVGTHHDFVALPNGHILVLAAETLPESGLTGFPNPVNVTGDVIIDLDENRVPVWIWSEFDHLDLNRHPIFFPDWTHTNAIVYSPDDKALIISIRHQHWIVKIDYNDGQGTGNIIWKLGHEGDFALVGGTDPQDWFYAPHDVNIISPNSTGMFQLLLFDNGNQRVLDSLGTTCGTTVPCESRVPIMQLDETAKTATIEWVDDLDPLFSIFGGSARLLANGNVEFDECAPTVTGTNTTISKGVITEVTKTTPPQTVFQMTVTGQNAYRAFRIPSLYPGVQW